MKARIEQVEGTETEAARVPARLVLLSASALWLLYYVLVTLRSLLFDDSGDFVEMLWRRALVMLAGIAVTMLAWPVIARFDRRSLPVRALAALVVMLPASLALAIVNQQVFKPLEARHKAEDAAKQAKLKDVPPDAIVRDDGGNILIDTSALRAEALRAAAEARREAEQAVREAAQEAAQDAREAAEDARAAAEDSRRAAEESRQASREPGAARVITITPPAPPAPPAASAKPARPAPAEPVVIIKAMAPPGKALPAVPQEEPNEATWQLLTDIALGRYFLLVAWAALYFALANAEAVRAAERREGEYRRAAKAAELRSLRYQVNPHFLFNTLNSLSALVMVGRTDEAERMIQAIASFYRHSLAADPTADLPLADEIALQRHYLAIEGVRFPERLIADFEIPPALEQACVPGMILQPLVENSIKYAVSPSRSPVTIRISAREAGDFLILTVADDGSGLPAGQPGGGTGIGLANVKDRLAARFGNGALVESGPLPAGGYATILTIPLTLPCP